MTNTPYYVKLQTVKKAFAVRTAAILSAFFALAAVSGAAMIPGGYLLLWAFREFLLDAVFTGGLPDFSDMVCFAFFAGVAGVFWFIVLPLSGAAALGLVFRVFPACGRPFRRLRTLPPLSWAARIFRLASGRPEVQR